MCPEAHARRPRPRMDTTAPTARVVGRGCANTMKRMAHKKPIGTRQRCNHVPPRRMRCSDGPVGSDTSFTAVIQKFGVRSEFTYKPALTSQRVVISAQRPGKPYPLQCPCRSSWSRLCDGSRCGSRCLFVLRRCHLVEDCHSATIQ